MESTDNNNIMWAKIKDKSELQFDYEVNSLKFQGQNDLYLFYDISDKSSSISKNYGN
jgi:hypothetical protein